MLTELQKSRFQKHLNLSEIGEKGQKKLIHSKVLVIGAGGLGSPVLMYLAAAGVGTLGIADADIVSESNLQRQVIYREADIGKSKVLTAAQTLHNISNDIHTVTYDMRINDQNIDTIIRNYDFVVDACDNFTTKFLINDSCVRTNIPFVHAGVSGWGGQVMTVLPHRSACLRCMLPEIPSDAEIKGTLGPAAGEIGCIEASEVIKYITGAGELLTNHILFIDLLRNDYELVDICPNPNCSACGNA